MREIKFRGKCAKTTKEWVFGYYLQTPTGGHFIYDGDEDVEVRPGTVGQFTGFLDENGAKVYEGDIISSNQWEPREYKVIFEDGEFCFVSLGGAERPYTNPIYYVENFAVIGNIHDNPELIGE